MDVDEQKFEKTTLEHEGVEYLVIRVGNHNPLKLTKDQCKVLVGAMNEFIGPVEPSCSRCLSTEREEGFCKVCGFLLVD